MSQYKNCIHLRPFRQNGLKYDDAFLGTIQYLPMVPVPPLITRKPLKLKQNFKIWCVLDFDPFWSQFRSGFMIVLLVVFLLLHNRRMSAIALINADSNLATYVGYRHIFAYIVSTVNQTIIWYWYRTSLYRYSMVPYRIPNVSPDNSFEGTPGRQLHNWNFGKF